MPKKSENLEDLKNSGNSSQKENFSATEFAEENKNSSEKNESDDEATLEVPKLTKQAKEKKPQTEAQKAATAKMRAKLQEKWERTRAEKAAYEEEHKKQMEEKVLKKAISIKKKQIKQQKVLDVISDDDTPMEEIAPLIKRKQVTTTQSNKSVANNVGTQKPRIIFM